ncbi:MAG TPA: stage II sporulation protein M [Chitinophagaceae bacterium]|nr:stage II sporulation protein M [Chitinophagaceae bacterium]
MREAAFIEQNKEKWLEIEKSIKNKNIIDPEILANYYIELTNDLAYAQTFYPKSKIEEYLNLLTSSAHQSIYTDKRNSKNQIIWFFKEHIPLTIYESRKYILYSFLIFFISILIGLVSSKHDNADFVRLILGDSYVNTTINNIANGDPAAIYASGGALGSSIAITINNIKVAFFAFALGIFLSVGTAYILFHNGVLLGAFHYLFVRYDVLGEAMTAIWIHGTIEIAMIILAGACGIQMGNSILFPKSYKRIDSFKFQTKKAGTILVSTIPFFIIAGFLEGYVSRHYMTSIYLSLAIILLSILLLTFYYIYLPLKIAKKQNEKTNI